MNYYDWSYVSLQEKRSEYNWKKIQAEEDLANYKNDYIILQDQEVEICSLINTLSDTMDLHCYSINTSILNVNSIGEELSKIPGFESLMDFSDLLSTNNNLSLSCSQYKKDLETICDEIDSLKDELGTKIANTKGDIASYTHEISAIDSAINAKY